MSNMSENQRAGFERATYSGSAERIRHGSEKGATDLHRLRDDRRRGPLRRRPRLLDGWAEWVVLGAIVFTAIGFMVAVSPRRQG